MTILLSSRDKPSKASDSGASTPNQADQARQKQKEQADAKALKRQAAEARVREKEQLRKQKEEEWTRRNAGRDVGDDLARSVGSLELGTGTEVETRST